MATTSRSGPDRCPGVLTLHLAQDGGLARVRVPGGRLSARQLLALAEAAATGNGLVELTARANVQIRGVRPEAAEELTERLAAAGLLPSLAHERARNVIASPLAGRHPDAVAATDEVLAALDAGLCRSPELAALPGRFLFAIDDGSGLGLAPAADVTVQAAPAGGFVLLIAGVPARRRVPAERAAGVVLEAARAFLYARAEIGSRAWRIAELADGPERVARRLGVELRSDAAPAPAARAPAPGRLVQRDGRLALTALPPLGQLDAGGLAALAAIAPEVRCSTARTVTIADLEPGRVDAVADALARAGLVLDGASGWVGLSACAGLGRCAQAREDVRGAAARRAAGRAPGAPPEHWTACERGCGRAEQPITVTATREDALIRIGHREHRVASLDAVPETLEELCEAEVDAAPEILQARREASIDAVSETVAGRP